MGATDVVSKMRTAAMAAYAISEYPATVDPTDTFSNDAVAVASFFVRVSRQLRE